MSKKIFCVLVVVYTSVLLSECCSDWEPVFLGKAGNGEKILEGWNRDLSKSCGCRTLDGCLPHGTRLAGQSLEGKHLVSPLVSKWKSLMVQQVKIELYKDGARVAYFVFNGADSDKINWFSQDRLTESSYDDLYSDGIFNHFSLTGDPKRIWRRFFINQNYGGCNKDQGWLLVADANGCIYERHNSYPQILYTKHQHKAHFIKDYGLADSMEIYIRKK